MNAPRKIIFVVTGLGVGGAEWQVVALAQSFKDLGGSVTVVTLIEPGKLKGELTRAGIPVLWLGMKRGIPGPGAVWRLAKIVRAEKPDVVHAHMFHANLLARVSRVLWKRVALICTIHSVTEVSSWSANADQRTWRDSAYRSTNSLATRTTAICDTAVNRYVRAGAFRAEELECVVNGIAVRKFSRDVGAGEELRKELGLEGKIVGVMVARMESPKDHALLLRAWAMAAQKNRNLHLVFVGDGPGRAELESLAASLGIVPNVNFVGVRRDVNVFLSMADFFLLITIMEGLPLVILEAAAASLPVIASSVGGIPEAVLEGKTGFLVKASDVDALANAITRVAEMSPADRQALGAAGKEMVWQKYDLEVVTKRWTEIYSEAMEAVK